VAWALLLSALLGTLVGGLPGLVTIGCGIAAGLTLLLTVWRREWEVPLHAFAATLLGVLAWLTNDRMWWLAVGAVVTIAASFWIAIGRGRRRLRESETKCDQLASQLDRRISELFSLQELSYVLSESIQLDRIVDQVAKYAGRFLQADGAIVVLADDEQGRFLRVAGAAGSLEPLIGQVSDDPDTALVRFAMQRERIEVAQGVSVPTVNLIGGTTVRSAAVAPLRSQGVTMGALAVADRQGGPFTTEDLWLLSTVATNASVVLANGRLYEIVRRSKDEWETAFNALAEGIAVIGPGDTILRSNRALAALAERPESELVGKSFTETLLGASDAVTQLIESSHRGERTTPVVIRLERSGRVLRITAAPFAERAGRVVLLVEDVTEQRILEAQLIQNDKMASIGQLVSGVAHELNNPLTSIAGLTELLLERELHPDVPREHLRVIHDQADRAGRIVRNLLTFARKGVPEKSPVDLNDVAARSALLIVYEMQLHGIELEQALSADPVVVLGDRHELQQVLLNLITNAVQAVSGLPPGARRRIAITTTREEGQAILRVRDTGPGVAPQHASALFTPFFTTKAAGQGTGLGLSLSYGLVKAHDGVLSYEPPAEGGAEFRVALPLYDAPVGRQATESTAPAHPAEPAEPAPRAARRVLVVDADLAVHRLVNALLSPDGIEVETVRAGEQGLRLACEKAYDLIIADAGATAGATELFVHALAAASPPSIDRLVVTYTGQAEPSDLLPDRPVPHARKPFNLRDLHALALQILASSPPRSPVSRAAR
jgi:two-component system NtrC family sensor kinase